MAWSTPASFSVNELVSANKLNVMVDDLIYLKGKTDSIFVVSGQTNQTVTILPVGANTTYCCVNGAVWDETASLLGTFANTIRAPGGASVAVTPGGGGGTTTITVVFNANGSITASRTGGASTWGLRLTIVYA